MGYQAGYNSVDQKNYISDNTNGSAGNSLDVMGNMSKALKNPSNVGSVTIPTADSNVNMPSYMSNEANRINNLAPNNDNNNFLSGLTDMFKTNDKFDMDKLAQFSKMIAGGIGAWQSIKQTNLMKEQFKFQKEFDTANLNNSVLASNKNDQSFWSNVARNDAINDRAPREKNPYQDTAFTGLDSNGKQVQDKNTVSKMKEFGTLTG